MADETSAPPAASATHSRKPARTTGAVTGADTTRIAQPVAKPAQAAMPSAPKRTRPVASKPALPFVRRRARPEPVCAYSISDDLPRPVAIGRVELEVLETYLGAALDALLREMKL